MRRGSPPNSAIWSVRPTDRFRAVLDEGGETNFRNEPVVGDHGRESLRGERFADESVIVLAAAVPAAAVEEHDNRRAGLCALGNVNIETLPRLFAIRRCRRSRSPG